MNSEPAEIKQDFLEADPKIPGQNFVCLSFVSPEKILKQKEIYFATKFLEHIFTDKEQQTKDLRENMSNEEYQFTYENIAQLYNDWKFVNGEMTEANFFESVDYTTSVRGLKVRGVYDTYKEASIRAQVLRKKDPSFNVGYPGLWVRIS